MKGKITLIETLDKAFKMMRLATMLVILLFILLFALSANTQAMSTENLFMVPLVKSNGIGAIVYQPQTGAGLITFNLNTNKNAVGFPKNYTPIMPNFQPPTYNPFASGSAKGNITINNSISSSLEAKLNVINNMPLAQSGNFGTLATTFTFIAKAKSEDLNQNNLMYRFDWNGDGRPDTYFSITNHISHRYIQPGNYHVTVEILDQYGKITKAFNTVTVVSDQAPSAIFSASKISAPQGTIIHFNTSYSSDNQYKKNTLMYRFDWDGDGNFDTNFKNQVDWFHLYNEQGKYFIIMEARDPEGLISKTGIKILINKNNPPVAVLNIKQLSTNSYLLNASGSFDDYSSLRNLKFRWDFNYHGNNDIIFDTGFSNSPKQTVHFKLGGNHLIRVEVMDEGGLTSQKIIEIQTPWNWGNLNLSHSI